MARSDSPLVVVGSRLLSTALAFVSAPILAWTLGPEGRGVAAVGLAASALLPFFLGLGLPLAVRRRVIQGRQHAAIRTVRLISIVSIPMALAIGWATAPFLGVNDDPNISLTYVVVCASAPLAILWMCDANVLLAQRRILSYSIVNLGPNIFYVTTLVVGVLASVVSVTYVLWASLIATVCTLILTSWLVRTPVRGHHESAGGLLRESVKFAGAQLAEVASMRLDQVLAVAIIGPAQAGFYAIAAAVGMLPNAVGQAIGVSIYRRTAEEGQVQPSSSASMATAIRITLLTAGLVSVALIACTPWLVPLIFGDAFAPAVMPTLIALLGASALATSQVASSVLTAHGRGWAITRAQIIGLVVGISLFVFLGPYTGAWGASLYSSIGYLTTLIILIGTLRLKPGHLLLRRSDFRSAIALVIRGR